MKKVVLDDFYICLVEPVNPHLAGVGVHHSQPIQNLVPLCNPLVLVVNVHQLRELPAQHLRYTLK